jgi:hypothetical protein
MRILLFITLVTASNLGLAADEVSKGKNSDDIPGISIKEHKPLPNSQIQFRIKAVRAVDDDLIYAAELALKTYDNDIDYTKVRNRGWKRHTIKRPGAIFGSSETIVLIRVLEWTKDIEIAIRGTSSFDDVVRDLDAKAEFDKQLQIPIHSGFRDIAQGVNTFLQKEFPEKEFRDYKFQLYGHSLGGAVANIAAMYLHEKGKKVSLVATFGAPRFTTNEGARKYQVLNQVTFRVVRCDDVVPFLPPPNFFGWTNNSYEASGNLLLLLYPPYFDYSVGVDIERDFTYQLRRELANAVGRKKLALGHRMDNYYALLLHYSRQYLYSSEEDIYPVSYQLSQQSKMCPSNL